MIWAEVDLQPGARGAWLAAAAIALLSMSLPNKTRSHITFRRWWKVCVSAIAIPLLPSIVLVFVPAVSPTAGAATADILRSVVGPEPVAQLESLSYRMRDAIYRSFSAIHHAGPQVSWATGVPVAPEVVVKPPMPTVPLVPDAGGPSSPSSIVPDVAPTATAQQTQVPAMDVVTAAPQIGWQAYGPMPGGTPLLARALVMVDPDRSYAGVALVRMDLSRLRLHIMAGFLEPAHPPGIDQLIPNLGMISPNDESRLLAAFNGGFKAIHGHYGMMVDGITLLQPVADLATVAVYRDGSVRIGVWGRDLDSSVEMIAFRQNCPPLVDAGQINPALSTDARKSWGMTHNTDVMWRTGLGITKDLHYLIYAVGNGTDAQFLADALQEAGAYNAMQLDINQYYAHFVTYSNASETSGSPGRQLQAQRLLEQMIDARDLFLTPYPRDFFYVTAGR